MLLEVCLFLRRVHWITVLDSFLPVKNKVIIAIAFFEQKKKESLFFQDCWTRRQVNTALPSFKPKYNG